MSVSFSWLTALLAATVQLASCQSRPSPPATMPPTPAYQTDKFRLSAGPCTPDNYPATILEGRFINSLGGSFPLPWGHSLDGNWGKSGIGWAVGEERQPVPDSLELRWFSYTEDKFYEGHFLLPQERLYELLKAGYYNTDQKQPETYDSFTVCVAPTGVVYVWLGGYNQVLVGRYQGRQIEYDFAQFIPMAKRTEVVKEARDPLPADVRAQIKAGALSAKKWDTYLKTCPWQVAFSQPVKLTNFAIGYINAEELFYPPTPDLAAHAQTLLVPSPRPVPKDLVLYVSGAYGRNRLFRVNLFDEAQTMSAFQTLAAQHPQQTITLFVEADERLSKVNLSLRAGQQVIPLLKSPVQIVELP